MIIKMANYTGYILGTEQTGRLVTYPATKTEYKQIVYFPLAEVLPLAQGRIPLET